MTATAERDVAPAEFAALRAEIVSRLSAQTTLVGVCLTAVGVVFGLALSDKGVPEQVVLVLPPITVCLGLFYAYNTRATILLGTYIRTKLWPALERDAANGTALASWERFMAGYRQGEQFSSPWMRARWMALEATGAATVFVLPSVVALVAYGPGQALDESSALLAAWIVDALLTTLEIVVACQLVRDYERL